MGAPGSRTMNIGLTIMLLSVSAGIHYGASAFGLVLGFTGVLAGANIVVAGVRMADVPAPTLSVAFDCTRALVAFGRRNTAAAGLVMASCAVTVVSGQAEPVLCFAMFAVLLVAVSLISNGVRGE